MMHLYACTKMKWKISCMSTLLKNYLKQQKASLGNIYFKCTLSTSLKHINSFVVFIAVPLNLKILVFLEPSFLNHCASHQIWEAAKENKRAGSPGKERERWQETSVKMENDCHSSVVSLRICRFLNGIQRKSREHYKWVTKQKWGWTCLINFLSSVHFVRLFPDGNKINTDQLERNYIFRQQQ